MSSPSIEDHVREIVAAAPPLTASQRHRIAALLRINPRRPQADHADLGITTHLDGEIGGDV
ncbi:hypothetical protein [Gordonia paraffinivorans]|uniref:hypothetical protein n=1 Tax=Gordonia paraffinivorans TaxID=175628 RepID=UPI0014479F54|nr:hypothetical protein [Gordonia paraffinivorans]MCD2145015.1 hypothetical protein [Gordonia paraffinivorans]